MQPGPPMTVTIYAIDSQFAAATGSNVNSGAGMSTFDYPPTSTHSLVITSLPGDQTPYLFSPGDTYSLTFSGQGGDTITNATVIRSDYISVGGDQGFAVVFEGLDSNGDLTQLVWTPEFDLESWYFNNFSGGNPPGFYNTDTNAASTYQAVCFEATMRIGTPDGPRPAEALRPGDLVSTQDNGPQPLRSVVARRVRAWGRHAPVVFESGLIGNPVPLALSQQHRLLLSVPSGHVRFGAPEVLLPAVAFVDGDRVRIRPRDWITYVHLLFDNHEIVDCEGVACESLYLGAMAKRVLGLGDGSGDGGAEALLDLFASGAAQDPARPFLGVRDASALLDEISGRPARRPAMLLRPGRGHARPFRLDPARGAGQGLQQGRPAFLALSDTGRDAGPRSSGK